ncbi:APC family permease [Gryllotalpicola protaetiae]|uniref:APC family permease n=1 Tax=Gryllotalpicola protaetiae TaxID=2419771 RepID=A0A387BTG0_9MICO|nr:APC family permease [Gryllotalpicola protaetiae]AYG04326.1 APC family permease [Gryllotalpicola protaetiae]
MTTADPTALPAASGAVAAPARPARKLTGRLGVGSIVFMVIAAAAPLTVVGGGFPVGALLGDGIGAPTMYLVGGAILLFFAVGLSTMSNYVPRPGAFFTYVGYGLGRPLGLAAAWLAILTYTTVQVAVYGYVGAVMSGYVVSLHGPTLPWFLYSLAMVAIVGLLGYRHIELSGKVLGVFLVCEIGVVLVLAGAVVATGGAEGLSVAPFNPTNVMSGAPALALMFALAGFIGFESTAIYRDEAKDPQKTIPRATYASLIIIAVFYTFASWALVMGIGPSHLMSELAKDPSAFIGTVTARYLGPVGGWIVNTLMITSMFACVLSFHNVITRYQHSMSNASVLPTALGKVHKTHRSPHASSIVQTITAAVLMIAFALFHLDPVLQVFTWFSGISTFAIVVLMGLTCLAVIAYFTAKKIKAGLWKTWIAPVIGFLGLAVVAVIIAQNFPLLIGDADAKGNPVFGTLTVTFLALMAAFPVFGIVQALVIKARKPAAYKNVIDTISTIEE